LLAVSREEAKEVKPKWGGKGGSFEEGLREAVDRASGGERVS
jgi:hypothetical protein